jgi:hypothetical protein
MRRVETTTIRFERGAVEAAHFGTNVENVQAPPGFEFKSDPDRHDMPL